LVLAGKGKGIVMLGLLLLVILLSGCGDHEKDTVTIFMMDKDALPDKIGETLEKSLQAKLKPELRVEFKTMFMYNLPKLSVEYAGRMNDIMILPKRDVVNYGQKGANLPLDEYFSPADYPEGVFEGGVTVGNEDQLKPEKHLYAIPASKLKMFKDTGFAPEELFVTVAVSTDNMEQSVAAIKAMMD